MFDRTTSTSARLAAEWARLNHCPVSLARAARWGLVDGFPRNTNNLSGWQQVTGASLEVGGVLFYDCSEELMEERLLERGKTSGRTDDNIESIRKRFKT